MPSLGKPMYDDDVWPKRRERERGVAGGASLETEGITMPPLGRFGGRGRGVVPIWGGWRLSWRGLPYLEA